MSGERYHPNLGSATLIIAAITLFFTLMNAIFGPWPGHFSEKMYGLPLLMGLLGIETSQPIWGPAGVFSFQEVLLLMIAAISGGVSYWARRLRPEFSVPEGMTLTDFGERQFTTTEVATTSSGQQGRSMTLESTPISTSPLSSDLLTDLETPTTANPTTATIVDNIIGDTTSVSPTKMAESFSNLGAEVAHSAPISGDAKVRDFGGTAEVVNIPLPGAKSEVKVEIEKDTEAKATTSKDLPEFPALPETPTSAEPEIPALPEVPALPEIPEEQGVPLLPTPITEELEELEAFPDLELDLPELPNIENQ